MDFSTCLPKRDLLDESRDYVESNGGGISTMKPTKKLGDWLNLERFVMSLFQGSEVGPNVIQNVQQLVCKLSKSETGTFLSNWCETKAFPSGAGQIFNYMCKIKGEELLKVLEIVWTQFFSHVLPTLQLVFYQTEEVREGEVKKPNIWVRKAALAAFRNQVILRLELLTTFEVVKYKVSPGIQQMFLVLQSVRDSYPPSENQEELEKLISRIIVPFLGFHGYYEGSEEPLIESYEPVLAARRRSSADPKRTDPKQVDLKRPDRPLSIQPTPKQIKNLEEIWKKASSRSISFNS